MPFTSFGLCAGLLRALAAHGFQEPTPIQAGALPPALAGRDVVAVAETGSGKTAAFLLPLLQRLGQGPGEGGGGLRFLVLVPTRELAAQVGAAASALGRHLPAPPRIRTAFGGVSINPQMMALRGGADLLVATPGRLLDLAGHNAVRLGAVEVLVLDEADRMLDLGFRDELRAVLALLPAARQNLLFSATRSGAGDLLEAMLKDPAEVGGRTRETPPEAVEQRVYLVAQDKKGPLLRHLIRQAGWEQVLVFVASHHGADTVARKLNNHGIAALAMHGDLSQGARTGALAGFKDGATRVLVATDLAARGLDIEQLPCVINYDLPRSPNDYVHRVGRTGRAGTPGLALSLVAPAELQHMRLIEKRTGRRLAHLDTEGMQLL